MGQNPTEEEIFQMISQVDDDNSGESAYADCSKGIDNQSDDRAKSSDDTRTIGAWRQPASPDGENSERVTDDG